MKSGEYVYIYSYTGASHQKAHRRGPSIRGMGRSDPDWETLRPDAVVYKRTTACGLVIQEDLKRGVQNPKMFAIKWGHLNHKTIEPCARCWPK